MIIKKAITPLDIELQELSTCSDRYVGTSLKAGSLYSEFVGKAMKLVLGSVGHILPEGHYCVAGGIFRALFYNEVPNDIDIFVLGTLPKIHNIMYEICENTLMHDKHMKAKYEDYTKNIHLITYSFDRPYSVQFIGQWIESNNRTILFLSADDIISSFDIVSSCFGVEFTISKDLNGQQVYEVNQIVSHPLLMKVVATKELMVNEYGPIQFKKMKADRFYKYIAEYGFRIKSPDQLLKFNAMLGGSTDVVFDYT